MAFFIAFMSHIKPQVEFNGNINLWCVQQKVESREHHAMSKSIGQFIRDRLSAIGKTQSWLAEECGVSNNAVTKWIKTGKVSRENLLKILPLLKSKLEDIPSEAPAQPMNFFDQDRVPYLAKIKPAKKKRAPLDRLIEIASTMTDEEIGRLIERAAIIQSERLAPKTQSS